MNKSQTGGHDSFSHPRLFYVRSQSPFPEIEQFVQAALHYYRYSRCHTVERHVIGRKNQTSIGKESLINGERGKPSSPGLIVYEGGIKASLGLLKQNHPDIEAVFMGTRSSDPCTGELFFG